MRDMYTLGFRKVVDSCDLSIEIDGEKVALPADFLEFQTYKPPEELNMKFKFIESTTSEEWVGQVVEFVYYDESRINRAVVPVPSDPGVKLLPISVDAGGNYTYMDITSKTKRIVDVGYETGAISPVAETFGQFIDMLVSEEE